MIDYFIKVYVAGFDIMWGIHAVLLGMLMLLFSQRSNSPKRRVRRALLVAYCLLVLAYTVLNREFTDTYRYELIPFWSYRKGMYEEIILNYLMFLPIGYWMSSLTKNRKSILFAFVFSATIEILQLVLKCGLFEFDDIIGNTFGAYLGYKLYFSPFRYRLYHRRKHSKNIDQRRILAQQIKPSIQSRAKSESSDSSTKSKDQVRVKVRLELSENNSYSRPTYHNKSTVSHYHNHSHSHNHTHRHHSHSHGHSHSKRHYYKEYYKYEDEYYTLHNSTIRHVSHLRRLFSI